MTNKELHHNAPKLFTIIWAAVSLVVIGGITALIALGTDRAALPVTVALTTAFTSLGAVLLFFMGIKDYTDVSRRAYILVCGGVLLYSLAQLQFPVFAVIDSTAWLTSGGVLLPYVFSIILIFWGMRRYAKLLDIHTPWRSFLLAFGSAIAGALLVGLVVQGDLALLLQFETLLSIVLFFSMMVALRIRSVIAARYRAPITYMAASFGMLTFAAFHHVVTAAVLPLDSWYLASELPSLPSLFAAILFIRAGYDSASVSRRDVVQVGKASPVNVVTYVAGIASRPAEIDPILDKLRLITSTSSKSGQLAAGQEKLLADIYIEIENYLIKHEVLQKIDMKRLRSMVRNRFAFDVSTKSPFWSLFK
jgi:hypothetical protein